VTRTRICPECGDLYEAVDDHDRLCKKCLLKRCRALVAAMDEMIRRYDKST